MRATGAPVHLGVCILPERPWGEAAPLWRRVEELGAAHAWVYDHLVWGGLPDASWHATMPTLAAAAGVTERIELGTFVASPNFRHPLLLAKDMVTLDDISGGRMLLGIGAGGDLDSGVLGDTWTRAERTRRFGELVPLLDRLLTEDHVDHRGEFFAVADARLLPGCVQRPRVPFVIAANGPRAMRLAATYGQGWITTGPQQGPAPAAPSDAAGRDAQVEQWWRGVAELAARMDRLEAEHRSSEEPLRRYLSVDAAGPAALSSVTFAEDQLGRAAEAGFTDVVVHWPRSEPPYQGSVAVLEHLLR
ncbi:LLM class flavin-dependent oxidoreductase [Ruania alba]|uniref:Flavin-dependent oxidoreductase, luciferase family (Includes alkanesulfonate monooxygenase SsuD and methylene tetrahydromethanopterin reductase) n=1 Tax=Ruania alba TaxID=648782 RepID=A0A1H5KPF2_9MICO|nr:LLM class flavin-dependent oxidoreductase [Ruania alba]SEE66759.1 Flavin-dependent oxidoreductase, luciferase family (includes alkanesulfonate monooxygenase SsuD and methylene tetrahydromethanopterin reductase) [Ruania alba]